MQKLKIQQAQIELEIEKLRLQKAMMEMQGGSLHPAELHEKAAKLDLEMKKFEHKRLVDADMAQTNRMRVEGDIGAKFAQLNKKNGDSNE